MHQRTAEHTKNVLADPRVSLYVVQSGTDEVQDTANLTLTASAEHFEPDKCLTGALPLLPAQD